MLLRKCPFASVREGDCLFVHFLLLEVSCMATTRIMPIHVGKGRSVARALRDITDYMGNPLKTEERELISSFECDARTAAAEFLLAKSRYLSLTGRSQGKYDVIAYHTRQSFLPGEITPEEANRIGYELAMRFTKGRHAFVVYTHTDRAHIHNHIVWNSTALDCKGKFRNFIGSAFALRRCSDMLCAENGLSVVRNPKPSLGRDYARYMFPEGKEPSYQDRLRVAIDASLEQTPHDFEEFLSLMKAAGYSVNENRKHITFLAPGQKRPTRMDTLRGQHTEDAVRERIEGRKVLSSGGKASGFQRQITSPGLLIDIQSRIRQDKGPGFERWAKVHNLKQMAKTLIYLQEHGLDSYDELSERVETASRRYHGLASEVKELDDKLAANASLQKHIVNYSKTRDTYVAYRKAGYSKAFRATHESEIILHQAAKTAFDELGYGKNRRIPTIAHLRKEYATVLDEKKRSYAAYREERTAMRELLTAKANVDRLLNVPDSGREREDIHIVL
jgi:hypothetical protein